MYMLYGRLNEFQNGPADLILRLGAVNFVVGTKDVFCVESLS